MIKVNLSNSKFQYEVYQIINLFYINEDINFVEDKADLLIEIRIDEIHIVDKSARFQFVVETELNEKENIKLAVFTYFKNLTKKEFPWGTLVGIRPSKIALNLINEGLTDDEIIKYYKHHYEVESEKARLCIDIAKLEGKFINKEYNKISVYIGMPFCPTKCVYCSFASNPIKSYGKLVDPYLQALKKEISSISTYIKEKNLKIECVYFGGGTPTSVDDNQFEEIMNSIFEGFVKNMQVTEFTVECGRPDSITEGKLKTMKHYGVHRISINPQTMNEETLKKIGRHHSAKEVQDKFNMAREMGFDNINMDLIVGLEDEGVESIAYTCEKIYELAPDSITVHGLSIKRASKLHECLDKSSLKEELEQSKINKMYRNTVELSKNLNMTPYYMYRQKNMFGNMENVGYSIPNKEGLYNIQMIEEKQTIIACGGDAVTKLVFLEEDRIERFPNVKDVKEYINRVDEMINRKIDFLENLYK